MVTVGEELSVGEIGGASETKTIVDIGAGRAVLEEKMNVLREIGHTASEIGEIRENWYALVRDGMDAQGRLSRDQEELVVEYAAIAGHGEPVMRNCRAVWNSSKKRDSGNGASGGYGTPYSPQHGGRIRSK